VKKDGHLSLTVKATDTDKGEILYHSWSATGGDFSIPGERKMDWSRGENAWLAQVEWKPPPAAPIGSRYTLRCTVTDSKGLSASPSPILVQVVGNGRLVFSSFRDGRNTVYIMNSDGSDQMKLTFDTGSGCSGFPYLSPDGKKIAFASDAPSPTRFYVMNYDGTGRTQISSFAGLYCCWSPDGSKIALEPWGGGISIINADGSHPDTGAPLTAKATTAGAGGHFPSWSPDGTQIAFSKGTGPGISDICVMSSDGTGTPTILTDGASNNKYPAWSSDGSLIAFSREFSSTDSEIYVMKKDGSHPNTGTPHSAKKLTNTAEYNYQPTWSPDDAQIAFARGTGDPRSTRHVYVMNSGDGSGCILLISGHGDRPSWAR
jgi:Tol biopolymer transport system component